MKDPYGLLGVSKTSSESEIKSAYRKLAKELHPDVNPGDTIVEQKFKEISAAYNLLSNKEKRAQYDRGEINPDGSQRGGYGGGGYGGGGGFGGRGGGGFSGAEDIFSDLFGRGGYGQGRQMRMKGQDVNYSARVSFLDAALGSSRLLSLHGGKSINLNVPAGTEDGQSLRLKGQGMPGVGGGATGDAFVEIQVDTHKFFERDGRDVFVDLPINLEEAVLGDKIIVPTIHGNVSLKIPAGSSSGSSLRLRGKGIKPKNGVAGDHYVRLKIVLPAKKDDALEEIIEKWASDNPQPNPRKDMLS